MAPQNGNWAAHQKPAPPPPPKKKKKKKKKWEAA
jgi:hypothetical protein